MYTVIAGLFVDFFRTTFSNEPSSFLFLLGLVGDVNLGILIFAVHLRLLNGVEYQGWELWGLYHIPRRIYVSFLFEISEQDLP